MSFRVNMTVEVDQVGNGLAIQTPVPIQLVCHSGRWQAACSSPAVNTPLFDTMQEALVAGAEQVAQELQAAVDDRPLIIARIMPDGVPISRF